MRRTTRRHRFIAIAAAIVLVLTVASVALAQPPAKTDGTGRATGYWDAYEHAKAYAPYTVSTTDGTGRATGYWDAYEDAKAYAPYTVEKTDGTGRATGYWDAYQRAFTR